MDEFWFNRSFRESSRRNYKKSSALRFTDSHIFMFFRNRASLLAFSRLLSVFRERLSEKCACDNPER